jgi:hypothetical protein
MDTRVRLIACLLVLISTPALALTVTKAKIAGEEVHIEGTGAIPDTDVIWMIAKAAVADADGNFAFRSNVPPGRDCRGVVTNEDAEVPVTFPKCQIFVRAIYSALTQDMAMVPPGQTHGPQSQCDEGDVPINGSFFATYVNRPAEFRITSFGPLGIFGTGEQYWTVGGVNEGDEPADIRLSAICADVAME